MFDELSAEPHMARYKEASKAIFKRYFHPILGCIHK